MSALMRSKCLRKAQESAEKSRFLAAALLLFMRLDLQQIYPEVKSEIHISAFSYLIVISFTILFISKNNFCYKDNI